MDKKIKYILERMNNNQERERFLAARGFVKNKDYTITEEGHLIVFSAYTDIIFYNF